MSESGDSGPGRREVAHRLFATEFDAASLEYADSDEERAPKYVITPTGARVNRLFVVGVLTEVERVNDEVVRARVVDPTGAFVVYAGQYQPDALAFLERADPPAFVAVTGKANTFQPEDSDRVYTSVRPESIAEVDGETRDRWTVQAAEHTLGRIDAFARALDRNDIETGMNGIALAREEYGTTPSYLSALRETAIEAATLVAGEAEEVTAPAIGPGEDDDRAVDLDDLHGVGGSSPATVETTEPDTGTAEAEPTDSVETSAEPETEPAEPATTESEAPTAETETAGPEADTPRAPAEPSESDAEPGGAGTEGSSNDLGDFDVSETEPTETEPAGEPETQADGTAGEEEIYEFDAEERAEIEAEFDMDFSSGNEVEEPGEAEIDVPDAEAGETTSESDGSETEPVVESEPDGDESEEGEINVEDRAMAAMGELADGDGADRETVVERVAEKYGVAPEEVDDAIESALLSGRCYEPQEGVLKPI